MITNFQCVLNMYAAKHGFKVETHNSNTFTITHQWQTSLILYRDGQWWAYGDEPALMRNLIDGILTTIEKTSKETMVFYRLVNLLNLRGYEVGYNIWLDMYTFKFLMESFTLDFVDGRFITDNNTEEMRVIIKHANKLL